MKWKRILAAGLAAGAVLTAGGAQAAEPETVSVDLRPRQVFVEGARVAFLNEQGAERDPLAYQGTIYIPLRTAGEWMGAEAAWDQDTRTVTLTTGGEPLFRDAYAPREEGPEGDAVEEGAEARLSPDITVVVDGEEQSFTNAGGAPVYPLVYHDSVYLPARSIGALCGKQVLWHPYPNRSKSVLDRVYFYDALTEEQAAAGRAYLARCGELLEELTAQKGRIKAARDWDEADYRAGAAELQATAEELRALAWPDISFLQTGCKGTRGLAGELVERYIAYELDPDRYLWPDAAAEPWQTRRDRFVDRLEQFGLRQLEDRVSANVRLLEAALENQETE